MTDSAILLLGSTGQVGTELLGLLSSDARYRVTAPRRPDVLLERPETLRQVVRAVQPRVIVNAAAYTAVDRAESEPELAHTVNAVAPAVLAQEAERTGAVLVHYSTDYVFDGTASVPYTESDTTHPINVYGHTKRTGELAVMATGARSIIFRTSWVYGAHGGNFLRTMLRLARERDELRIVSDQIGTPTSSRAIARATVAALAWLDSGNGSASSSAGTGSGIYHLTGAGSTSWYEFARAILERDPERGEQRCERIIPVTTAEYPTAARRPGYSVLDSGRIASEMNIRLPHWEEQLDDVIGVLSAMPEQSTRSGA